MISLTHQMKIVRDGFAILENVLDFEAVAHWISELVDGYEWHQFL